MFYLNKKYEYGILFKINICGYTFCNTQEHITVVFHVTRVRA
ncbi:hypothetical protein T11_17942 [Trichinella zimbabwensis]|uniref:Uncharacterized protein n=1 Tax=Trichinella zimbabwensis TaxID=268475 RepID=A0A0V1G7S9_9BILA|nr:hypothetical protein T11_17942 [Trichinella zimbabwensis]